MTNLTLSIYASVFTKDSQKPYFATLSGEPVDFVRGFLVKPELAHCLTGAFQGSLPPGSTVEPVVMSGLGDRIFRSVDINHLPDDVMHLYTVDLPELDYRMAMAGYGPTEVSGYISYRDYVGWVTSRKTPNCYRVTPRSDAIVVEPGHPLFMAIEVCGALEEVPLSMKGHESVNTSHWVNTVRFAGAHPNAYRSFFGDDQPTGYIPLEVKANWEFYYHDGMDQYSAIYRALADLSGSSWDILVSICLRATA